MHRLGGVDSGSRGEHGRYAGIDGKWAHDKFSQHDQLVSYPVQQHREDRVRKKERTDNVMDTSG